ncbi:hypothetical protein AB4320_09785, partial [Vibrio splendidus]
MYSKYSISLLLLTLAMSPYSFAYYKVTNIVTTGHWCNVSYSKGQTYTEGSNPCNGDTARKWHYEETSWVSAGKVYAKQVYNTTGNHKSVVVANVAWIDEPTCKTMEGESLGTVAFPVGTASVASVCNNECKANLMQGTWISGGVQDDARPFGHYNYTGDPCDGKEGSGGGDGSTGG